MDIDTTIKNRKSVNSFTSKKPSWKSILKAIDAANKAPFAGNQNNLKFIIIESPETIKKIATHCKQSWISQSKILIVICSDPENLERLYGERGRIYSKQQTGASIENFLLKLTDLGLSTSWVGAFTDKSIRTVLKIPFKIEIEAILPIGYPDSRTPKKRKQTLDNTLYWEQWSKRKRPTIIDDPDITKR